MRPPPPIHRLPELVANQIAAGEVVERPAAVVKELVENSLDAGATRVAVRIEDGGRRLIEVCDDGHGMRPEDLGLALERHATSKIRGIDDLQRVATLGFRGEALPSIAAVSEFEIASRPHDAEAGWRLVRAGERRLDAGPCAMAPGTRVTVRNLFWNVPARLKFLKLAASETAHISEQMTRFALSHPQVAFSLAVDGRQALQLPPLPDLAARVRAVFGDELADDLLPVAAGQAGLALVGFVAHPRQARPHARMQYLFCNGRFVRDRLLAAALRQGCQGFLEPRLHAAAFLRLDIAPEAVDVNVHPTKQEVRFRREGEVFALVSRAVQEALAGQRRPFPVLASDDAAREARAVAHTVVRPAQAPLIQERYLPPALPAAQRQAAEAVQPYRSAGGDAQPPCSFGQDDALPPGVRRVWQVHDSYLVIETEQGLRFVDQHALHEKVLWLALDPEHGDLSRGGVQELAVPIVVRLTPAECDGLAAIAEALAAHGIRIARAGPSSVAVHAHPAALARCDWARFLAEVAAEGTAACERLSERIRHRAACHAAVKAGTSLDAAEQRQLVRWLYTMEGLAHCPHGRPTTLDLSWDELARRFQR